MGYQVGYFVWSKWNYFYLSVRVCSTVTCSCSSLGDSNTSIVCGSTGGIPLLVVTTH